MYTMLLPLFDCLLVFVSILTVAQIFIVSRPEESAIKMKYLLWAKDSELIRFICEEFYKLCSIACAVWWWRLVAFIYWYYFGNPGDAMADQARVLVLMSIIMMNAILRRLWVLCQVDFEKFKELGLELSKKRALAWKPTSTLSYTQRILRRVINVKSEGLDRVPREGKRLLFICNHLLGPWDHPLLLSELSAIGIHPRGVTSTLKYWDLPILSDVIRLLGSVSLFNAKVLIERGDAMMIYGARKEEDEMQWRKGSDGFVKVLQWALQNDYRILPCSCVGASDVVDMVYRVGIEPARRSTAVGTFWKWICSKQKKNVWYWFGEPMEIKNLDSSVSKKHRLAAIKQEVMDAVTDGIGELFTMIKRDNSVDKDILNAMRGRYRALSEIDRS